MSKKIIALAFLISSLQAMTFQDAKQIEKKFGVLKAISMYKTLASKNDKQSIFHLAMIYSKNKPFKRNLTKTHDLLQKASNLDYNKATFYLGKLYLSKKSPYYDLIKAYNTFLIAANKNYAPAQNMIAQFLVNGTVVDKDYKMAVNYFERAAKQNYLDAQCNLAFMYASGKGVFPNFGRANAFAKKGVAEGNKKCIKVWEDYNLKKYPEDKAWKFNFYTKPE